MKRFKRSICIVLLTALLTLSGCNTPGYQQTEATEKAVATYLAAVEQSIAQKSGSISITIRSKDTVIKKGETTERYEYTYTVENEQDEHFDYRCYDEQGQLLSHYKTVAQGETGKVIDQLTGAEKDGFKNYLMHSKNPISTLQLFRMDGNLSLQHSTISSITMEEMDGAQVITVTFHPDKLTGLAIQNENGLNRRVTSHKRIYTLKDGKISKIEIYDRENVHYNQETGTMDTDTVVEVIYP